MSVSSGGIGGSVLYYDLGVVYNENTHNLANECSTGGGGFVFVWGCR